MAQKKHVRGTEKTEEQRKRRKRRLIAYSALSLLLIAYIFFGERGDAVLSGADYVRLVCDACFVNGLIYICLFVLSLCYYYGAFDLMLYGAGALVNTLAHWKEEESLHKQVDLATYLRQNGEVKRLNKTALAFAGGFFTVGAMLLVIYYVLM